MRNKLIFHEIANYELNEKFFHLLSLVSKDRQQKISNFKLDIDKKLSLYAEIIVRKYISQKIHLENFEIEFEENKYGKPYLKGYPDFFFNISHTHNAIVVALSNELVGVDVEKIKTADLAIAKRFFSDKEIKYIHSAQFDQDKRFYEIWTRKEAYIKHVGKGLSIPLKSFDVQDELLKKRIKTFYQDEYVISVCSSQAYENIKWEYEIYDEKTIFTY